MQACVMLAEARLFGPLINAIAHFTVKRGGLNIPHLEHENGSALGAELTSAARSRHPKRVLPVKSILLISTTLFASWSRSRVRLLEFRSER